MLNNMLEELKRKVELDLEGVNIDSADIIKCSGEYSSLVNDGTRSNFSINNQINIVLSKKGIKSTWNDVYKVINTIQAAKYDFI